MTNKRIVFTALWSGVVNNRHVSNVCKFSLSLSTSCDAMSAAIQYLHDTSKVLGFSDFLVKEVSYDV